MIVKAFCAASFTESTRRAAGVEPLTAPPVTLDTFTPTMLEGCDFLYLDLHGQPGQPYFYGDEGPVCSGAQVRRANLAGAIVFAVNCFLADRDSPMLDALLDAGARYVVSGPGPNYGGERKLFGAPLLGQVFLSALKRGWDASMAISLAKRAVRYRILGEKITHNERQMDAYKDALDFRLYERKAIAA